MGKCRWTKEIERSFDGEETRLDGLNSHLAQCKVCSAYLARLQRLHAGLETLVSREEIHESQFPAFVEGIRERIGTPRRGHRGLWAFASVAAAAVIVALCTLFIVSGGPRDVSATVVESATTELEGVTIDWYSSDDGTTKIWVTAIQGKDVW